MSLSAFRDRLEDAVDRFLWRQWAQLGVSSTEPWADQWLLDPEALLAFTLEAARNDARLFDEVLDWLLVNGDALDVQRLRNLVRQDENYPTRLLGAVAGLLADNEVSAKWRRLADSAREPGADSAADAPPPVAPEPLFTVDRTFSAERSAAADPHFATVGLLRPPFTPRQRSSPVPTAANACLRFRLRALFGIGIRAELIAFLGAHRAATVAETAEATAYSLPGVQQALRELAASGTLTVQASPRGKLYALDAERWWNFLGLAAPAQAPAILRGTPAAPAAAGTPAAGGAAALAQAIAWVDWVRLFRGLAVLLRLARRPGLREKSEYLQFSDLREAFEQARPDLEGAQLDFHLPVRAGQSLEAYAAELMSSLQDLTTRLRVEPPTPLTPTAGIAPRDEALIRRLHQLSPAAATFVRDAAQLLATDPPLASASHLLGHLLREAESSIRAVLLAGAGAATPPTEHGRHAAEIARCVAELGLPDAHGLAALWKRLGGELHRSAHRSGVEAPRAVDEARAPWPEFLSLIEGILNAYRDRYGARLAEIDRLLAARPPTRAAADALIAKAPTGTVNRSYVCEQLREPAWLAPLLAAGFFRYPPDARKRPDGQGQGESYPAWPESRLLDRLAAAAPREVAAVIQELPETKNPWVHRDAIAAAARMPAALAAGLAARMVAWLRTEDPIECPLDAARFALHLARGGSAEAALAVFDLLLDVRPAGAKEQRRSAARGDQPCARYAADLYDLVLDTLVPDAIERLGLPLLDLLCRKLQAAVQCVDARGSYRRRMRSLDILYSDVRQDRVLMRGTDLIWALLQAACVTARRLAQGAPEWSLRPVLGLLDGYEEPLFGRIALDLLEERGIALAEVATARVLDPEWLHRWPVEYQRLLHQRFADLAAADKLRWLRCIEQGPPPREDDAEEPDDSRRRWRTRRLALVAPWIPAAWRKRHAAWCADLPANDAPSLPQAPLEWLGTRAVGATVDLRSAPVAEILSILATVRARKPGDDEHEPEYGIALKNAVAADPDRFAAECERFADLGPELSAAVLDGFREALRAARPVPWPAVLALATAIIEPASAASARSSTAGAPTEDPHAAGRGLADLLASGMAESNHGIPLALRESVWRLLERLAEHADPTPETEAARLRIREIPFELAINCVRGQALSAVVQYAVWVRRATAAVPKPRTGARLGFGEMPEVARLLERHLDLGREPSLAVRSIYGRCFPCLMELAPKWTDAHLAAIFPEGEAGRPWRQAAWESYLCFAPHHDRSFAILEAHYRAAVESLADLPADGEAESAADIDLPTRLAQHLMVFFARGRCVEPGPRALLAAFFETAPDRLRGEAVAHLGHLLRHSVGALHPDVANRLQQLWQERLTRGQAARGQGAQAELAAFGWWFASGALDDRWAVERLVETLRLSPRIESDWPAIQRLARLAARYPAAAVAALALMVEGCPDNGPLDLWLEEMPQILQAGLRSGDAPTQEAARQLLLRLVRDRGKLALRPLLVELPEAGTSARS
ncbi:MAG: hypothetical protein HZA54_09035 [Planctomycetes bacterium]|nr:hypothetical protein [Planctomycetota bacterium]